MTETTHSKDVKLEEAKPARRRFLGAAATGAAGVAAMAAPMISIAQAPTVLKMQGAWGAKDIFNEMAEEYVKRVNEMSEGRLRIDYLVGGAVVKPFEVMDAVSRGVLDAGHQVPAYWYGKSKVASLFGSGPITGCDAPQTLAWIYRGGGLEMYQELLKKLNLNVVGYFAMPMPTQPLGWFKKTDHERRRDERPEIPHGGPGSGSDAGDGREGHATAWWRDRAGHGPRRDRGLRVQQPDVGPPLRRAGRGQDLHDGQLPPGDGVLRDRVQQAQARCAAEGSAGGAALRGRSRPRRPTGGPRWTTTPKTSTG